MIVVEIVEAEEGVGAVDEVVVAEDEAVPTLRESRIFLVIQRVDDVCRTVLIERADAFLLLARAQVNDVARKSTLLYL